MNVSYEVKTAGLLPKTLPLIIFVEGFVSIAVEILAIRQLLPVAGSSVIVTSLIIGIFLLFLAIGYQQGGRVQQNRQTKLHLNFLVSAAGMGIGLSYLFVIYFFYAIQHWASDHIIYPLVLYLLLIISPLAYLLGQTVPITMGLARKDQSIASISGTILGLNTLGSFLGAIITSLVFMQYLGVAWAIVINTALLMGLILLSSSNRFSFFKYSILGFLIVYGTYVINVKSEHQLFILTNSYANYQILQPNPYQKIFSINHSASSIINNNHQGAPYIELIKKILFQDLQLRHADILVLGAGGFTLTAENAYDNQVTYVDIDKAIKKAAIPRFVPHFSDQLAIQDARQFIQKSKKQYQVIIIDVYSNKFAIPAYLLTQEFFFSVKQKLTDSGTAIFNFIINPLLQDRYSKRIDNTVRAVFNDCMGVPLAYQDQATNVIYICHQSGLTDTMIYTDNLNRSTTDSFEW